MAAHVVEEAYAADGGDLDSDDIAAVEDGLDDLQKGNVVSHQDVISEARKKYGW